MSARSFRRFWSEGILFPVLWLTLFGWTLLPAHGQSDPRRVGIVPLSQSVDALSDLLMAELSKQPGIQMLERGEIRRVLDEQAVGGFTARAVSRTGQIVVADLIILLAEQSGTIELRVVGTKFGGVLSAFQFQRPEAATGKFAEALAARIGALVGSWTSVSSNRIPVTVLGHKAALAGSGASRIEAGFSSLLVSRLSTATNLVVLERQAFDSLGFDRFLSGSGAKEGAVYVSGTFNPDGVIPGRTVIRTRMESGQRAAVVFDLTCREGEELGEIETVTKRLLQEMGAAPGNVWQPETESVRLVDDGVWALRWGLLGEGVSKAEAAWALEQRGPAVAALRLNLAVRLLSRDETDPARRVERFRRALDVFEEGVAEMKRRGTSSDEAWMKAGNRLIEECLIELRRLYYQPALRVGQDEGLAEARRRFRKLVEIEFAERGLWDAANGSWAAPRSFPMLRNLPDTRAAVGDFPPLASHPTLRYQAEDPLLIFFKLGHFACQTPEESVLHWRRMLSAPWYWSLESRLVLPKEDAMSFGVSVPHDWYQGSRIFEKAPAPPPLVGWNWETRQRVTATWKAYCGELLASTNLTRSLQGLNLFVQTCGSPEEIAKAKEACVERVLAPSEEISAPDQIDTWIGRVGSVASRGFGGTRPDEAGMALRISEAKRRLADRISDRARPALVVGIDLLLERLAQDPPDIPSLAQIDFSKANPAALVTLRDRLQGIMGKLTGPPGKRLQETRVNAIRILTEANRLLAEKRVSPDSLIEMIRTQPAAVGSEQLSALDAASQAQLKAVLLAVGEARSKLTTSMDAQSVELSAKLENVVAKTRARQRIMPVREAVRILEETPGDLARLYEVNLDDAPKGDLTNLLAVAEKTLATSPAPASPEALKQRMALNWLIGDVRRRVPDAFVRKLVGFIPGLYETPPSTDPGPLRLIPMLALGEVKIGQTNRFRRLRNVTVSGGAYHFEVQESWSKPFDTNSGKVDFPESISRWNVTSIDEQGRTVATTELPLKSGTINILTPTAAVAAESVFYLEGSELRSVHLGTTNIRAWSEVPIAGPTMLIGMESRLTIVTADSILILRPEDASVSILASLRRRPAQSPMDSLDRFSAGNFPGVVRSGPDAWTFVTTNRTFRWDFSTSRWMTNDLHVATASGPAGTHRWEYNGIHLVRQDLGGGNVVRLQVDPAQLPHVLGPERVFLGIALARGEKSVVLWSAKNNQAFRIPEEDLLRFDADAAGSQPPATDVKLATLDSASSKRAALGDTKNREPLWETIDADHDGSLDAAESRWFDLDKDGRLSVEELRPLVTMLSWRASLVVRRFDYNKDGALKGTEFIDAAKTNRFFIGLGPGSFDPKLGLMANNEAISNSTNQLASVEAPLFRFLLAKTCHPAGRRVTQLRLESLPGIGGVNRSLIDAAGYEESFVAECVSRSWAAAAREQAAQRRETSPPPNGPADRGAKQ